VRAEVLKTLEALAERDERIVFLTGDLGYGVVEQFFRRFPDRAFNAGVAEQNMVAMATGMAEAGLIPFVYSIATFASMRPFEFIRNGPVIHGLPVRIIGVGGGLEYSNNGPTHFALEDVAILRTLPGLRIVCPNDSVQACAAVEATYESPGPIYYRLSKNHSEPAAGSDGAWAPVGAQVLSRGDGSVAVLALGPLAGDLAAVAAIVQRSGRRVTCVAVAQVAPLPSDLIQDLAQTHELLVTIEAHRVVGGLGTAVCELVAESCAATRVLRLGIRGWPSQVIGSAAHLARWAGLDQESIAQAIVTATHSPSRLPRSLSS
jgi:transketolase